MYQRTIFLDFETSENVFAVNNALKTPQPYCNFAYLYSRGETRENFQKSGSAHIYLKAHKSSAITFFDIAETGHAEIRG